MFDGCRHSSQSLKQRDLLDESNVSSSSLEDIMFQKSYSSKDITSHNARQFISLASKDIVVRIRHSLINSHLNNLLLLFNPFTLTSFTLILFFHSLTCSSAFVALHLSLSNHPWSQLNHFDSYAVTLAILTLDRVTAPFAITIHTHSVSSNGNLLHATIIDFFKGNFHFDQLRLHFLGLVVFLLGVKEVKYVVTLSGRSTIFDPFLSILIVQLSLLRVRKGITCILNPSKLLRVSSSIWMFFECFFSESLFDLLGGSVFGYLQQFIVLCGTDLLFWLGLCSCLFSLTGMLSKKHESTKSNYLSNIEQRGIFIIDAIQKYTKIKKRRPRSIKISSFTKPRHYSRIEEPKWTIDRLTTNYTPQEIVGRDEQKQYIHEFVQDCVMNRINAKVLYISGIPGVGKTASTMEIVRKLEKQFSRKVKVGFVNAMSLKKPEQVYKLIWDILSNCEKDRCHRGALANINIRVEKLEIPHLIVIDQVDFLITRDEKIFYNLFEWASNVTSKLGFILIANTMDFPQRLSPRVNSRMGNHRLVFAPYNYDQIRKIIDERLKGCNYFASNALTFISKKLSTYSSDMRTILEVLRHAVTDHIDGEKTGTISIDTIHKMWEEKVRRPYKLEQQRQNPSLYSLIIKILKRNNGSTTSIDILDVMSQKGCTQSSLSVLIKEMEQQGMVTLKQTSKGMYNCYKVTLVRRHDE